MLFHEIIFRIRPSPRLLQQRCFGIGSDFIDNATIKVSGGKGGDGHISYASISSTKLRPDGGSGGSGGNVYIEGTRNLRSLFLQQTSFKAENGSRGDRNNRAGAKGKDFILKVPCGTEIYRDDELICDIIEDGQRELICLGGVGGFGNEVLAKMSMRTEYYKVKRERVDESMQNRKGSVGDSAELFLTLKLLADLGLVGFPNAGKSSILGAVSRKKPKIAAYPFTTLHPTVGVLQEGGVNVHIADIPGITETSATVETSAVVSCKRTHEFLQHIERNRGFIYVVGLPSQLELGLLNKSYDVEETKTHIAQRVKAEISTLLLELEKYQSGLSSKPAILAINKLDNWMDLFDSSEETARLEVSEMINSVLLDKAEMKSVLAINVISVDADLGIKSLKQSIVSLFLNIQPQKKKPVLTVASDADLVEEKFLQL